MSRLIFGTSTRTPEEIASQVLAKAGKGQFHIVLNWDAKVMYRLKRYFPNLMLWIFRKGEQRKHIMEARLKSKFERMEQRGEVDHDYLNSVFGKKTVK